MIAVAAKHHQVAIVRRQDGYIAGDRSIESIQVWNQWPSLSCRPQREPTQQTGDKNGVE